MNTSNCCDVNLYVYVYSYKIFMFVGYKYVCDYLNKIYISSECDLHFEFRPSLFVMVSSEISVERSPQ